MNELIAGVDMTQWTAWKRDLVGLTDLDRDALHIYVGVIVQVAVAVLTRRKLGDWLPWLVVAAVAVLIEGADIYAEVWPSAVMQGGKAVHDIVNTLAIPTFLLVLSRRWPQLAGRG